MWCARPSHGKCSWLRECVYARAAIKAEEFAENKTYTRGTYYHLSALVAAAADVEPHQATVAAAATAAERKSLRAALCHV